MTLLRLISGLAKSVALLMGFNTIILEKYNINHLPNKNNNFKTCLFRAAKEEAPDVPLWSRSGSQLLSFVLQCLGGVWHC